MNTTARTARVYTARTLSVLDLVAFGLVMIGACWEAYRQMIRHEPPAPTASIVALVASGLILSGLLGSAATWADPTHPRHRLIEWVTQGVAGALSIVGLSAMAGAGYTVVAFDHHSSRHLAALVIVAVTFGLARLLFGWLARLHGVMHSHDDDEIASPQERVIV